MKVKNGFTLIELLVVISIIGILAAMATVSYTAAQKQARDVTRKSDIKQYQTLMESYANNNSGLYPSSGGFTDNLTSYCSALGSTGCPSDPTSSQHYYLNSTAKKYVVGAKLENPVQYFIVCSNGKVGFSSGFGVNVDSDCPI